jgi:16S rRNA (cytosine967-C5)-methyltransferase
MRNEQRLAALTVQRVLAGATLQAALAAVGDERGRALVQELTYGTLRHWGRMDALAKRLAAKPLTDPLLHILVALALYQLDHTGAPAFAVVDQAVEAATDVARPQAKPLVNAMLRRYLRERDALNAEVAAASPVARWSYPRWWIGRVEADQPKQWQSVLTAGNERPPLTLRVNARVTTREALAHRFADAGIAVGAVGDIGLIVREPQPVTALPGFADGAFSVQDAGAQLAAPLLGVHDGMRVLDACAAPGGKTTHIAELARASVTAIDADAARLARVTENVRRLRLSGIVAKVGDAANPAAWWDGAPFDRILADVPCTASGIVRRHPDAKWLRRKSDLAAFAAQQERIVDGLWPLLARGGKLLYATCSVFAAENELQISRLQERHKDALRETISFPAAIAHDGGQLLPSGNAAGHNQDGFFYALLRKG